MSNKPFDMKKYYKEKYGREYDQTKVKIYADCIIDGNFEHGDVMRYGVIPDVVEMKPFKMTNLMNHQQVFNEVVKERHYQGVKYGFNKEQSLPVYILIMQSELNEAMNAWLKNKNGDRQTALEEILQVVATGFACLETYGVKGSAVTTNDIPCVPPSDRSMSND